MRILLLVTGELERRALPSSLAGIFPTATFEVRKLDGFTNVPAEAAGAPLVESAPDPLLPPKRKPELKLADAMAAWVLGDGAATFDLIVLLDDLEVCNVDDIGAVLARYEAALRHVLGEADAAVRESLRAALRQKASFHLMRPMLEAWFFAEEATLREAGAKSPSAWPYSDDAETFSVHDQAYRSWPHHPPHRGELHPKRYLDFLNQPGRYAETVNARRRTHTGQQALCRVDWHALAQRPGQFGYTRALLHDLATALGASGWPEPEPGVLTRLRAEGGALLRNL